MNIKKVNVKPYCIDLATPVRAYAAGLMTNFGIVVVEIICLLYTSPSPRDGLLSRMPSSA